jgi:cell division protein FtsN
MVQIGAFSSQALAEKGWNDAARLAPGMAAGKGKSVQAVESGGKTVYRTAVTGFGSRADATAFCNALKAGGKDCFIR